jgi:phage shock protein PspC (stress-responsive transcriptional regulator)
MKKTFTINISGSVFHIEEDAYEVLQKYLVALKNHFGNSEEGKEILADIESRIAEIFLEKSTDKKQAVTLEWVNEVIETMGTPENFEETENAEEVFSSKTKQKRKLYRDPEQSVLGGVCGGLSVYFNMDPVVVRLIAFLLFLFTSGFAFLVYIIMWIAVPKAVNTAQRLEMRGEEVTVKNIEKFIKDEVDAVKESYNKFKKNGFFSKKKA